MNTQLTKRMLVPIALLLIATGLGNAAQAQVPPAPPAPPAVSGAPNEKMPVPPPPPDPERQDGKGRPAPPDRRGPADRNPGAIDRVALQPVSVFKGTLSRFLVNPDLVYDGFMLNSGTDSFMVHFPSALGESVLKSMKTGTPIAVMGVQRTAPAGEKEIDMVSVSANGVTIENQPPAAPAAPAVPTFTKGSGKITGFKTDREGRIDAILLDDHKVLRLPAAALAAFSPLPPVGSVIAYTGTLRATEPGEAVQNDSRVVRCRSVTVNGQQYLVSPRG